MMGRVKTCVYLCIAALLGLAQAKDVDLTLTTEEAPPHIMHVNGQIVGIAADRVVELMHRAKLTYSLEMLPWARAYRMAQQHTRSCVFSTTRTKEREAMFKWVGPLDANDWVFYGLPGRNFHLTSAEDARTLRIGTYIDDVRDTFLREKGFSVDTATNDEVNAQKLMAGRIDLWASSPLKALPLLIQNNLTTQIVPILTFNHVDLFLACNRSVPDDLIEKLNGLLNDMNSDGTSAAISKRYARWPEQ